jgi:hypothetical protein
MMEDRTRGSGRPASQDAALAIAAAAGVVPLEPYRNANAAWLCRCLACGREVRPRLKHMAPGRGGCRHCAEASSTANAKAKAAREQSGRAGLDAHGLEPLEPYPGNRYPWRMRHAACGQEISPSLGNLAKAWDKGDTGCAYCSGHRVDPVQAAAIMHDARLRPLTDFPGSNAHWPCECLDCHRVVRPSYSTVAMGHRGCKWCSGVILDPAEAEGMLRSFGFEPLVPYPGSERPWRATHAACGREAAPSLGNLRGGTSLGCMVCRTGGFDAGSPAILYLVVSEALDAAKAGITKESRARLAQHEAEGWAVARTLHCRGDVALLLEQDLIARWRTDLGLGPFLAKAQMPQGGYTETVHLSGIDIAAEWRWIRRRLAALDIDSLPDLEPRSIRKPQPGPGEVRAARLAAREADALPVLAERGLTALAPFPGVTFPWPMACDACGHEFSPVYANVRKGSGCPMCARATRAAARRRNTVQP